MYHYFAATEIYNAIRVFIAAYVWMTGFGNFSYYYVRKDFSMARFAQVYAVPQKSKITSFIFEHVYFKLMIYQSCLTDDVAA